MKSFLTLIGEEVASAFERAGYERDLGRVGVSNRPDLCEYQCNGAMAGAKRYKKGVVIMPPSVQPGCVVSTPLSQVCT